MAKSNGKPLGIGIIGCGLMGGIHAESFAKAKGARLIGFTNRTRDKAEQLAKKLGGGEVFDSVEAMLADPRIHPVIEAVKAAMPKLGRCYHLDLEMCFRIGALEGRCWMDYRSGGFFMELGVHLADLARHIMGPIDHVQASTLRLNPKRVTED